MIIVTRIMRTGGTAFWKSIKGNFKDGQCWQKDMFAKRQYKSVGGLITALKEGRKFKVKPKVFMHHLPYGVHKLFDEGIEYDYVTFLRDPIRRLISHIYYALHIKYSKEYEKQLQESNFFEKQLILQNYLRNMDKDSNDILPVLEKCIASDTICNIMTKQLSGLEDLDNIATNYAVAKGNLYTVNHTSIAPTTEEQMEALLEAAKYNLKNKYSFIGFQENGSKDHKLLCEVLRWKYRGVGIQNASIKKPNFNWQHKDVIDALMEMTKYDIELFKYALEIRDDQRSSS